jgi:hypothetical protein
MSTRFYSGQKDYVVQLNLMEDEFTAAVGTVTGKANRAGDTFTGNIAFPRASATAALSTAWGTTSGTNTGGLNVVQGTGSQATWLLSGTSGGVFRSGIQSHDTDGTLRFYQGTNFFSFASGTLTATTFSGALSGNATTATTLQTARTINGVSFNGSANISVPELRGTNGTTALMVTGVTSGVNYLTTTNSIAGSAVSISTAGTSTDIGLNITTKGNGNIVLDTGTGTGDIELRPGAASLRLYDDDSSHYFQFLTGNITANYNINLPAANVTLVSGTMVPTTGTGATGTWGISISGNAATVTNGVYTTGNQTVSGIKTFSDNLGVGITPSAYTASSGVTRAADIGNFLGLFSNNTGNGMAGALFNAYFDSGTYRMKTGGAYAGTYEFTPGGGIHYWKTSGVGGASGTAIALTTSMQLDASGNLGVGGAATAGERLCVQGGSIAARTGSSQWFSVGADASAQSFGTFFQGGSTNAAGYLGTDNGGITSGGSGANFGIRAENDLILMAGAVERARISAAGVMTVSGFLAPANNFTLQDPTDTTKQATFVLSGITTGTVRNYTLPNLSGTLATTATLTQTFSGTTTFSAATNTFGSSTAAGTTGLATGATVSGSTKTVNIGTAGVAGSTTVINFGPTAGAVTYTFNGTSAVNLPVGTTAQRPTGTAGDIRLNSTTGQFEGHNGAAWGSIGGGAKGGGPDQVFIENDSTVTTSYTIGTGKNAMCVGPLTINAGAVITVPAGSRWVVI